MVEGVRTIIHNVHRKRSTRPPGNQVCEAIRQVAELIHQRTEGWGCRPTLNRSKLSSEKDHVL